LYGSTFNVPIQSCWYISRHFHIKEYLNVNKEQSFGIKSNQRYANPAKSQEYIAKK